MIESLTNQNCERFVGQVRYWYRLKEAKRTTDDQSRLKSPYSLEAWSSQRPFEVQSGRCDGHIKSRCDGHKKCERPEGSNPCSGFVQRNRHSQ